MRSHLLSHLDTGAAAGELPCKMVLPWEDDPKLSNPQSQKPSSRATETSAGGKAHLHDHLCSNVSEDSWEGVRGESAQGTHGKVVSPNTNPLMENALINSGEDHASSPVPRML